MTIPFSIFDLEYSKHAKEEWWKDKHGQILNRPRHFVKSQVVSCKNKDGCIVAEYSYNNKLNLILVINSETKTVVTNYFIFKVDKDKFKGKFKL